uniref:Uncharacterized protein n=1 Tax=Oryza nivara TaxID=4536 RepID=A0A0E0FMG9_ORYNI
MSMWSASAYTCRGPRETIRATRNIVGGEIDGDLHVEDGDGLAVESGDGVVVEGGRRRPLSRGTCLDSTQREKPVSTEFIEVVVFVCAGWETLPLAQKK